MIADADIFLTNVRPAPLQRATLDYETLHAENPRLIYAHLTAWGQTGPMSENPGYDVGAFWAASGLQDFMRTDEDAEPPRFPGGIGDHTTTMQPPHQVPPGPWALNVPTRKGF